MKPLYLAALAASLLSACGGSYDDQASVDCYSYTDSYGATHTSCRQYTPPSGAGNFPAPAQSQTSNSVTGRSSTTGTTAVQGGQ